MLLQICGYILKNLLNKKWRSKNKNYLKEFERISTKALDNENIDKNANK